MTATPQKLRLMLIEGAMGAARQALNYWEQGDDELASASLSRCRNIISELLAGVSSDSTALTKRVAGVYVFIFKLLTEAQLQRNTEAVQKTLEILAVEQETWRMVCEKMPHAPIATSGQSSAPHEITSSDAAHLLNQENGERAPYEPLSGGGFTIDA
jgi:flagellar protein FliS